MFHWFLFILQEIGILEGLQRIRLSKVRSRYFGLSNSEIFQDVYLAKRWGASNENFFSGSGSRDLKVTGPYIQAISKFFQSFEESPNVLDLGCGDFSVGSQLRTFCKNYTAIDVVPGLVEYNKKVFNKLNVDFRCLDIVSDELPPSDVVVVRQVLQHLDNLSISKVLYKLRKYKWVIITEHISTKNFIPNLDIPSGPATRVPLGSGVDVTQRPFSMKYVDSIELSRVKLPGSELVSIAYKIFI